MFLTRAVLDLSVRALETRDFPLYRSLNAVPSILVSDRETVVLADEAALRENFERLCALADPATGRRLERSVTAEQAVGARLVQATVLTRIRSGTRLLLDPFHTLITWRRTGAGWEAVVVFNPVRAQLPAGEGPRDWRPWSPSPAGPFGPAVTPPTPFPPGDPT